MLRTSVDIFSCKSCPKSLRLRLGRHAIPHGLHANPRKRINRTSEASHFLSLSVFSVSRVAAVFCVFSSVEFGVFRAVPWLPTYIQRISSPETIFDFQAVVTHIRPKTRKKTNPNCTPNIVFGPKIGWFYFNFSFRKRGR